MANIDDQIKQLKEQLARAESDLKLWESYAAVTVTDARGKVSDVRADMITRCKLNMQKYREHLESLEKKKAT